MNERKYKKIEIMVNENGTKLMHDVNQFCSLFYSGYILDIKVGHHYDPDISHAVFVATIFYLDYKP